MLPKTAEMGRLLEVDEVPTAEFAGSEEPEGPAITQGEVDAIMGRDPDIEAEIESHMDNIPPAAEAQPGPGPGGTPAETAGPDTCGRTGPLSRGRRGAQKPQQQPLPPAAGAATPPAQAGAPTHPPPRRG